MEVSMKTKFEIIEEYIDYHNDRDVVDDLTMYEQVLYKGMLRDTSSFIFFYLYIRIKEFIELIINSLKKLL